MTGALLLAIALFTNQAQAGPRCLIIQNLIPVERDQPDRNIHITNFLANEIEAVGRVTPIVYSQTDPIFRDAAQRGLISKMPEAPTLEEAKIIARELKAEYLLVVESSRAPVNNKVPEGKPGDTIVSEKAITFRAQLHRANKEIWSDKRSFPASRGTAFDSDNDARTVARTTYLVLDSGPWKGLAARSKVETPTVDPGQLPQPSVRVTAPPSTQAVEAAQPMAELAKAVAGFIKAGDAARALSLLRTEIDGSPQDLERRVLYVDTLITCKMPNEAIEAAQGATRLFPERIDLRVRAASSALAIGEIQLAQSELSEAVVRSPKDPDVRLLLAQIALLRGEPAVALNHLGALEARPSDAADIACLTRLANALDGKGSLGPLALKSGQYGWVAQVLDESATTLSNSIRSLHQKAIVKRSDPEVVAQSTRSNKVVAAVGQLVKDIVAPESNKKSHLPRALAWSLLVQSLDDFALYLKNGDEDSITESRINLGEAIKHLNNATRLLVDERSEKDVRVQPLHP